MLIFLAIWAPLGKRVSNWKKHSHMVLVAALNTGDRLQLNCLKRVACVHCVEWFL